MTDTWDRPLEPSTDAVRRMVEVLAPRLPGVAERTAARAVAEIPEYAVLDEAEVLEGIQRDLGLAVSALVEARGFTDADRATMGVIGDTRAVQGLPLEGMLRVYRMTVDEIFRELWDAAEIGELQPFEVLQLTSKVWAYAGPLMDLATSAYRARELELALADSDRRTGLVHELLLSPSAAPASVAAAIGLDPLRDYVAFRARTTTDAGGPGALLSALKLPGVLDGGIAVPYEGDVIGLAPRRPSLVDEPGVVVGLGPAGPLAALPSSFALATRTVETATAFGLHGVLTLDRVPLHAMTRAEAELAGLLHARCVAPVLDARAPEVLETVRAFLDLDLAAEATAEALAVHPNTVRNRLHRFEALTGLSLRRLDDLVQLRLALLHQELSASR